MNVRHVLKRNLIYIHFIERHKCGHNKKKMIRWTANTHSLQTWHKSLFVFLQERQMKVMEQFEKRIHLLFGWKNSHSNKNIRQITNFLIKHTKKFGRKQLNLNSQPFKFLVKFTWRNLPLIYLLTIEVYSIWRLIRSWSWQHCIVF